MIPRHCVRAVCDYECVFRTNSDINVYIFSGRWQRLLPDLNALLNYERDNDIISIGIICIYISNACIFLSNQYYYRGFHADSKEYAYYTLSADIIYASAKYIAAAVTVVIYIIYTYTVRRAGTSDCWPPSEVRTGWPKITELEVHYYKFIIITVIKNTIFLICATYFGEYVRFVFIVKRCSSLYLFI